MFSSVALSIAALLRNLHHYPCPVLSTASVYILVTPPSSSSPRVSANFILLPTSQRPERNGTIRYLFILCLTYEHNVNVFKMKILTVLLAHRIGKKFIAQKIYVVPFPKYNIANLGYPLTFAEIILPSIRKLRPQHRFPI